MKFMVFIFILFSSHINADDNLICFVGEKKAREGATEDDYMEFCYGKDKKLKHRQAYIVKEGGKVVETGEYQNGRKVYMKRIQYADNGFKTIKAVTKNPNYKSKHQAREDIENKVVPLSELTCGKIDDDKVLCPDGIYVRDNAVRVGQIELEANSSATHVYKVRDGKTPMKGHTLYSMPKASVTKRKR